MQWYIVKRNDIRCRILSDRHYSRRNQGTECFTPPGKVLVLYTKNKNGEACWVTLVQYPQYVDHAWKDSWNCSLFRNENAGVASELIKEAIMATRYKYGDIPSDGMITFINKEKVKPTIIRGIKSWGFCYKKVGFEEIDETKNGLLVLQLSADKIKKFPAKSALYENDLFSYNFL